MAEYRAFLNPVSPGRKRLYEKESLKTRDSDLRGSKTDDLQAPDEFHLGIFNLDFIPLYMDRRNISI
jgi:hypothetical protein